MSTSTHKIGINKLPQHLINEWNYVKNNDIDVSRFTSGSGKLVWWTCQKCGYEWQAKIYKRTEGYDGCFSCRSLFAKNPELAKEWNFSKNKTLLPWMVTVSTAKKVWWKCRKGHEWEDKISDRNRGNGCSYCSGHKVDKGNCLSTVNPKLASEWHPTKNGQITPNDVTCSSNKKVWWKCRKGHEWQTVIYSRTQGRGCPYCYGVILKDGTWCNSLPEAYMYLKYKMEKLDFYHNKKYGSLGVFGNCRYDFYFPRQNKYVEVTSFDPSDKKYKKYFKNIEKKKVYVQEKLGAIFEFIRFTPTVEQINYVRKNSMV